MFKLFNKKEPKANWLATADDIAGLEDYYKEHKEEFAEFEAALEPLRDEQSKARFIIKRIYARHGIDSGSSWIIYDNCLDEEAFTDLCEFNEDELASLRKWTQRYKELETEIMNLGAKYRNASLYSKLEWTKYLKEHK
jgi:hypothetical protein